MKLGFVSLVITQETGRHFTNSEYFKLMQSDIRTLIPSSRSRHSLKHFFWDVTPCSLVRNIPMFNRNVGIYLPNSFEIMINSYRNQCLKSQMNVSKFIYDFGSGGASLCVSSYVNYISTVNTQHMQKPDVLLQLGYI